MLTASTKGNLRAIRNKFGSTSTFRMPGTMSKVDLEKEVSALKDAVTAMLDALLAEPDEKK
jgi:hypothetical protein